MKRLFLLLVLLLAGPVHAYTTLYDCGACATLGYADSMTALDNLITANPTWSLVDLGDSAGGRDIKAVVINGSAYDETWLVTGGLHGNERTGMKIALNWLNYLSGTNPYPRIRWVVVPIMNPDGWVANTRQNNNAAAAGLTIDLANNSTNKYGDGVYEAHTRVLTGDYSTNVPYAAIQYFTPTADITAKLLTWSIASTTNANQMAGYKVVIFEADDATDTDPTGKVLAESTQTAITAEEQSLVLADLALSSAKVYGIMFVVNGSGTYIPQCVDCTDGAHDYIITDTDENGFVGGSPQLQRYTGAAWGGANYVMRLRFWTAAVGRTVDLNRNFTLGWGNYFGSYSEDEASPNSQYYRGPSAASEPETTVLANLLTTYAPDRLIDNHTALNKVITCDGAWGVTLANTYYSSQTFDAQTNEACSTSYTGMFMEQAYAAGAEGYIYEVGADAVGEEINRGLWFIKSLADHRRYMRSHTLRLTTTSGLPITTLTYNGGHDLTVVGTAADGAQSIELTGLLASKRYAVTTDGVLAISNADGTGALTINAGDAAEHTISVKLKDKIF